MTLDPKTIETLQAVSTATLTTILLKKGLRNVWMRGTKPIRPGQLVADKCYGDESH